MTLDHIEIRNFRCFKNFSLPLTRTSLLVVSENGAGKTTLLQAILKALGKDRFVSQSDFADISQPIEIIATLTGFGDRKLQRLFPKELNFTTKLPHLKIGFKADWDPTEEVADTRCGFPSLAWKGASREQRDAFRVVSLPAYRDVERLLSLGGGKSLWNSVLKSANLTTELSTAATSIENALAVLLASPNLSAMLTGLEGILKQLIPGVDPQPLTLSLPQGSDNDLLQQFRLQLSHGGTSIPVSSQSNGLAQLAIFTFTLQVLKSDPLALLLVDEPEISLHPHAQRAISSMCRALPNQSIICTHSANILDRADLRTVVRLHRDMSGVTPKTATTLTDQEASRLARFVNPLTAEGCFARKIVLVEGYSDRVLLTQLASRLGKDLDASGVSVVALDGGNTIGSFFRLYGPAGLGVMLGGFCDSDKETYWIKELANAGFLVRDRSEMARIGFEVCDKDLEEELVKSIGSKGLIAMIATEGDEARFVAFQKQPNSIGLTTEQQLHRFLHNENTRYAVPLADAVDLNNVPASLLSILSVL